MPPALASVLTAMFIAGLFVLESQKREQRSPALWIPVAWLLVTGSRFISQWLTLGQPIVITAGEGSTIDALFFLACIVASAAVLLRRRVSVRYIVRKNAWIVALLLFGLLSVLWSDFPFVALKRWVKVLGHPLVALVILTDLNPKSALITVMKRCAFLLLPVSVLFIKYYPEFGRGFDLWSGQGYNMGVGLNGTYLGFISLVLGLFYFWYLTIVRQFKDVRLRRIERIESWVFICMAMWLLYMSDSATALSTMIVGLGTMVVVGLSFVNKQRIGTYVIVLVVACVIAEEVFDLYETALELLNRDPTLTDRTAVWADALALQPSVLFGAGFESFWLGTRVETLWEKWWWRPNQAHNGYIETYLNLGLVGVLLLGGVLLSAFRKICRDIRQDFHLGRFWLALFFVLLFYNYTEATFTGVHFMWTVFYIAAINYPAILPVPEKEPARSTRSRAISPPRLASPSSRLGAGKARY